MNSKSITFLILIVCSLFVACTAPKPGRGCPVIARKPKCGSDGAVYPNTCLLKHKGLKVAPWKKCRCNTECYLLFEPVCGSNGIIYNNRCLLLQASCHEKGKITEVRKKKCCKVINSDNKQFCKKGKHHKHPK